MNAWIAEALLVSVFVLDILALGTSRVRAVIRYVALQGFALAGLSFVSHTRFDLRVLGLALLMAGLKGVAIPFMLGRAARRADIRREVEPFIGLGASMALGALGAGLSLFFARYLPLVEGAHQSLLVPAALTTVFTGFLLLTTRLKAISQVLGYLVLENGIFLFGALLLEAVPFLVEVGVLLDLVVAIFVMGLLMNLIHREFSTTDTRELSALKEE